MSWYFSVNQTVVGIRDVESSCIGIVKGYDSDGKVLVKWPMNDFPVALPAQSVERVSDRKDDSRTRPIGHGKIWEESENLGDYLTKMATADSGLPKEKKHEKNTR